MSKSSILVNLLGVIGILLVLGLIGGILFAIIYPIVNKTKTRETTTTIPATLGLRPSV